MCETGAEPEQPADAAAGSFLKTVQQILVCDDVPGKRDRRTTLPDHRRMPDISHRWLVQEGDMSLSQDLGQRENWTLGCVSA